MEVHVDGARLHSDLGMAETSGRQVLSDAELEMLLCDCRVGRVVFGPASEPIDVGRSMRLVGGPIRRALVARDRRCRFPGCDRPHRWCDAHHLVPWAAGGPTATDNLVLLCRHHHTLINSDRWQLRGTPTDLIAERHDGYRMVSRPPP